MIPSETQKIKPLFKRRWGCACCGGDVILDLTQKLIYCVAGSRSCAPGKPRKDLLGPDSSQRLLNFVEIWPDELKLLKFTRAYIELGARSKRLARTKHGEIELWETKDKLLTVVDMEKREFLTKMKDLAPQDYASAKRFLTKRIEGA